MTSCRLWNPLQDYCTCQTVTCDNVQYFSLVHICLAGGYSCVSARPRVDRNGLWQGPHFLLMFSSHPLLLTTGLKKATCSQGWKSTRGVVSRPQPWAAASPSNSSPIRARKTVCHLFLMHFTGGYWWTGTTSCAVFFSESILDHAQVRVGFSRDLAIQCYIDIWVTIW